jgi:DNA-binding transcriptional regulator YdaS (Cro superfamily)
MANPFLSKAVELAGGQAKLAAGIKAWHKAHGRDVKISQAHVWNWLNSDTMQPPAEHCRAIEDITNGEVTRYQLRPDVFGNCRPKEEAA